MYRIVGVVVFTGGDTKLMRNSVRSPRKVSTLERQMNALVLCIGALQLAPRLIGSEFKAVAFASSFNARLGACRNRALLDPRTERVPTRLFDSGRGRLRELVDRIIRTPP